MLLRRSLVPLILGVILAFSLSLVARAQTEGGSSDPTPVGREAAFEKEVYDRLVHVNPQAADTFREATAALDAGDNAAASAGFMQVLSLVPDFPDALRRLGYAEAGLGHKEAALAYARRAYQVEPSGINAGGMARVMLELGDAPGALPYAKEAAQKNPDDFEANWLLTYAGIETGDLNTARTSSKKLVQLAPENPYGYFFLGIVQANDYRWEAAETNIRKAGELGMPAEDVQQALDSGISRLASQFRWLRRGAYPLAGWLAGFGLLFVAGLALSRATLSAVRRPHPETGYQVSGAERFVRSLYRVVISLTSLYFYLSIPVLILIILGVTAGVYYLFYVVGQIPLRLALIIGMMAVYTLAAIVVSLFARVKDDEPGRALERDEAPELWTLVEAVAQKVGTRPVEVIYIFPGTEIAVLERGSLIKKLRGVGQRCLILGLGALPGMTQGNLQAILAHEYGHFSNRDTAGGNLASQVQLSIQHMGMGLALRGMARWYNPAWWFVNGFYRLFLRVTLGASRLQEVLADRYAALACGVQDFVAGLQHIVRQSLAFEAQANGEINLAVQQGLPIHNLYTLAPLQETEKVKELEKLVAAALSRPTGAYDSHPSIKDRVDLVAQIRGAAPSTGSLAPVWDLLPDPARLQEEMTAQVQGNITRQLEMQPASA